MTLQPAQAQDTVLRQKMTYQDYLDLVIETRIIEWVDGEGISYMPATTRHQLIVRFLSALIDAFVGQFELGRLLFAPFEVKLWPEGPSREPDILFVGRDNLSKLTSNRFEGAPDLLIEVISTSSVTEDRVRKFAEYEQAGVREYWIIDPRPFQEQADFFVRGKRGLFQAAPIDDDGIYRSLVLPGFWLKLDWLWQEPHPQTQYVLAEILSASNELVPEIRDAYRALLKLLKPG